MGSEKILRNRFNSPWSNLMTDSREKKDAVKKIIDNFYLDVSCRKSTGVKVSCFFLDRYP